MVRRESSETWNSNLYYYCSECGKFVLVKELTRIRDAYIKTNILKCDKCGFIISQIEELMGNLQGQYRGFYQED